MYVGLLRQLDGAYLPWNFEGEMRRALKTELLPLWKLCEGTWREGYFTGDHGGYVKTAPKTGRSLHKDPTGELESGFVYRGV